MGDGTRQNPYTREDVLRRIRRHGSAAKGLDLSGKVFEESVDLRGLNLNRIILARANLSDAHLQGAKLRYADLQGAKLNRAHLEEADLRNTQAQKAKMSNAQMYRANLTHAHLEGAILRGANLNDARLRYIHLEGANLRDTNFEKADLRNAHLEEARLQHAQLEETDLTRANLERVHLHETVFSPNTKLVRVYWGSYTMGEESKQYFLWASDIYRQLKMWHINAGIYDIAGEFFFREMTAKRKNFWWQGNKSKPFRELLLPFKPKDLSKAIFPRKPFHWAWSKFISLICGYGEKPLRVIGWAASVVFGLAAVYYLLGGLTLPYSLYYSAVSFTALGYGNWASPPIGWVQGFGALESFIGVFTIALFLITFVRKMTR